MRSTRKHMVGWVGASCVLSGVIVQQIRGELNFLPEATAVVAPVTEERGIEQEEPPFSKKSADRQQAILARPLFSVSRRPAEVSADGLSFELVGIMQVDGEKTAILSHPESGMQFLSMGASLEGWTMGEIGADQVDLRRDGEVARLELRKHKPQLATDVDAGAEKLSMQDEAQVRINDLTATVMERRAASKEQKALDEMEAFAKEAQRSLKNTR